MWGRCGVTESSRNPGVIFVVAVSFNGRSGCSTGRVDGAEERDRDVCVRVRVRVHVRVFFCFSVFFFFTSSVAFETFFSAYCTSTCVPGTKPSHTAIVVAVALFSFRTYLQYL